MRRNRSKTRSILLRKLYEGTATATELDLLMDMIKDDPSPPDGRLLEKIWEEVGKHPSLPTAERDRRFEEILLKTQAGQVTHARSQAVGSGSRNYRPRVRILQRWPLAAGIALTLGLALWLLLWSPRPDIVQTAFGEQQELELSDGSKVRLNSNSRMTYKPMWDRDEHREIWLEGEAFFEVQRVPEYDQKFVVVTDDLTIEVLGTAFNVNSYGGRSTVYLEEGSIILHIEGRESPIVMEPGDLVAYSKQSQKMVKKRAEESALHTSWKTGVLTFKDSPLSEVLKKIEDTYGVKFRVENPADYQRKLNFPLPIDEIETAITILDKTIADLTIYREAEFYVIE